MRQWWRVHRVQRVRGSVTVYCGQTATLPGLVPEDVNDESELLDWIRFCLVLAYSSSPVTQRLPLPYFFDIGSYCARAGLTKRGCECVSAPLFLTVVLHEIFGFRGAPVPLRTWCILGIPQIAGPHLVAIVKSH